MLVICSCWGLDNLQERGINSNGEINVLSAQAVHSSFVKKVPGAALTAQLMSDPLEVHTIALPFVP